MGLRAFAFWACVSLTTLLCIDVGKAAGLDRVYARVKPGVVYVVCAVPDGAVSGSGFVLSSDHSTSEIVTANHVVEGASSIDIIVGNNLKRRYAATVIQHNHVSDVAVLEIKVGGLQPLKLIQENNVHEGMTVAAIGYPRAARQFEQLDGDDLRPSIHAGVLSAIRLNGAMYQFDAPVDHGDSGGPVIDASTGAVLGIVRGALLDPTYLSLGLEQALPGSAFAMSATTIEHVVRGDEQSIVEPAMEVSKSRNEGAPNGSISANIKSSADSFRIGLATPRMETVANQGVVDLLDSRLSNDLTGDNSLYLVPTSSSSTRDATAMNSACQDGRLVGFLSPTFAWNWRQNLVRYPFVGYSLERSASSGVGLSVVDCSGQVIFSSVKTKSETKSASARTWDQQIVAMDQDLLDQIEHDFAAFRSANKNAWQNFLKSGLFIDPADDSTHALFSVTVEKGVCRVQSVYPRGPSALAGLHVGDILETANGSTLSGLDLKSVQSLLNGPNRLILVIKRPEGEQTISIIPRTFADLEKMLGP